MHIVIFGATSAIAHSLAITYAQENNHAFTLIGRNEKRLSTCKDELLALGASRVVLKIDSFSNLQEIEQVFQSIIHEEGAIDIAILAHGSLTDQERAKTDIRYLLEEFTLNAISHIVLSQMIVNHFNAIGRGILLGIGSVAGERGRKGNYAYGSAKSAMATFLSGLRHANTNPNIRIMTIKPGFVATPMTAHLPSSPLFVSPNFIAKEIRRGIDQNIDHMYIPSYWRLIMMIIRAIPEALFKKINI
ncbi:MAG: SDR family NAD(P)-dependent oxidoreductase [Candidatus Kapaibacteriota bacterium]